MIATVIGHRNLNTDDIFRMKLKLFFSELIERRGIDTFLFGSRSAFNTLCLNAVTEIKQLRPHIRRIYVRAEFPNIDRSYESYLLEFYDETYFPDQIANAGKAVYLKRNFHMIDRADLCVFYYDPNYLPCSAASGHVRSRAPKSGTEAAYNYALKLRKTVLNLFPLPLSEI